MNHPLTTRAALPFPAREPHPADPTPEQGGPGEPESAPPPPARAAERGPKLTQADVLLRLGMDEYHLVQHDNTSYAVPLDGPPIARPLRAKGGFGGTGSLRQLLNRSYVLRTGRAPGQGSLTDAIAAMDALALDAEKQPVHLRVAPDPVDPHGTWLDLGRADGLSVCIEPGTWSVTTPPVHEGPLWRRTKLTGELPLPERDPGGWQTGIGLLRELSPLSEQAWPLAVAWLLAALRPDMPRPVAYFNGERGTAKSTAARQLLRLIDGIDAEVRGTPRSEDDGAVAASAGWTMGLDNLAGIPQWLSDFLCRAVTGQSVAKREMYTDDDVASWSYQRPLLLTGIDVGALEPDLAERLLPFTLDTIGPKSRRSERDLWTSYRRAHARILGGLLDLAALVWAKLPDAADQLTQRPRMADWAELLWALDAVTGWNSLATYTGSQHAITDDVIDADPVATALTRWARTTGTTHWQAPTSQIDETLRPPGPLPEKWPKTTALLSARLTSLAPALRQRGIDIRKLPRSSTTRGFLITLDPDPSPST
ncbi:hypothetical protein ABZ896_19995 [Streptomyces sp. NPDC047072]|uniref:hypothetical protein n=1 Tax=Streptomyces sp. NPDC047072 TaxID=3154809 RepID=UPI0033CA8142